MILENLGMVTRSFSNNLKSFYSEGLFTSGKHSRQLLIFAKVDVPAKINQKKSTKAPVRM